MYDNLHTFYAGPLPISGCNCLACQNSRRKYAVGDYEIPVQFDWTELWKKYSYPYSSSLANEESVPTEQIERSEKNFIPSGIYQINYSIVDNYGFASTHSVVLKTQVGKTPQETFSDFMNASEGYVRYDLIEYFLVRWGNGEYVKV